MNLTTLSRIGIGTYNLKGSEEEILEAYIYGVDNGINIVDTAPNYALGRSEALVGRLLNRYNRKDLFVISKVGYISSGEELEYIRKQRITDCLYQDGRPYYSLDADFVGFQLQKSLARLGTHYIDALLLHNPHYYLHNEAVNGRFYEYLEQSLAQLDRHRKNGVIHHYGISSRFLSVINQPDRINLKSVLFDSGGNRKFEGLDVVQFPFNLIESEASGQNEGGDSLLKICMENSILTLGNRTFNAWISGSRMINLVKYRPTSNQEEAKKELRELIFNLRYKLPKDSQLTHSFDHLLNRFMFTENKDELFVTFGKAGIAAYIDDKEVNEIFDLTSIIDQYYRNEIVTQIWQKKCPGIDVASGKLPLIAASFSINAGVHTALIGLRSKEFVDDIRDLL